MGEFLIPLNTLKNGEKGTITSLNGGQESRHRIISMGIIPGSTIQVIKKGNSSKDLMITAIGDTRVVIGQEITDNILVKPD